MLAGTDKERLSLGQKIFNNSRVQFQTQVFSSLAYEIRWLVRLSSDSSHNI